MNARHNVIIYRQGVVEMYNVIHMGLEQMCDYKFYIVEGTAQVWDTSKNVNMARNDPQQKWHKSLLEFVTRLGSMSKVVDTIYLDTVEDILINGGETMHRQNILIFVVQQLRCCFTARLK